MAITNKIVQRGPVHNFLGYLQDWKYAAPSDNLWTFNIRVHNNGLISNSNSTNFTFNQLYKNIDTVNQSYTNSINTIWRITKNKNSINPEDYFNKFDKDNGLFLVQEVNIYNTSVSVQDTNMTALDQHRGFLQAGKIVTMRNYLEGMTAKFLVTNWSVLEIFFDKWISAIAQQGLIEDSQNPQIKADIIINQYARSIPNSDNYQAMELQKSINLIRAFPFRRDQLSYSYDGEKAGVFKVGQVNFKFDDYIINYEV